MSQLGSAQSLGGVYVSIGGDLAPLVKAEADAKAIATRISALNPIVKVTAQVDTAAMQAQLKNVSGNVPIVLKADIAALQSQIRQAAVGVPLIFDTAIAQAQIQSLAKSFQIQLGGNGPGGGQLATAAADLTTAATELQGAAADLVSAAQVLASSSPAGGRGGGTRTGGGGRGNILNRNPLSARGLGPLVGGAAFLYLAHEIGEIVGGERKAAYISQHPEEIVQNLAVGQTDPLQDSYVMARAREIANVKAKQERISDKPLGTWLDNLISDPQARQETAERAQREIDVHERAVQANEQQPAQLAALKGDAVGSAQIELQSEQARIQNEINRSIAAKMAVPLRPGERPGPSRYEADPALTQELQNTTALGNEKISHAQQDFTSAIQQVKDQGEVYNVKADEAREKAMAANPGQTDSERAVHERAALLDQQKAERMQAQSETDVALAKTHYNPLTDANDPSKAAAGVEYNAILASAREKGASILAEQAAQREQFDREEVDRERETQQRLSEIHAQGSESILRAEQRGNEAEQQEFLENAAARMNAVRNASPEERAATAQSIQQEGQALLHEQERQRKIAEGDLETRHTAAIFRQHDEFDSAKAVEDTRRAIREVEEAPAELKHQTAVTAEAELKAEERAMLGFHSGGYATMGTRLLIPGDPLDLSKTAEDRKLAKAQFDSAQKQLAKLDDHGQGEKAAAKNRADFAAGLNKLGEHDTGPFTKTDVTNIVNYLQNISQTIQPYAVAH